MNSSSSTSLSRSQVSMKRVLGVPSLVIFALAYMVPLGVFTTFGPGLEITDGHLAAAYVVITIAMLFTAISYGRMARLVPSAGSGYAYARRAFGPKLGFISGWTLLADYLLLPMLNYLVIGLYMSEAFPSIPSWIWVFASIIVTTTLNVIGIRMVTSVNLILCVAQVVFLGVFIALALKLISGGPLPSLSAPFYSDSAEPHAILAGAAILCLSFLGFDAISALSEEAKDPRKTVPRAIMISVIVLGLLGTITVFFAQLVTPNWTMFENLDTAAVQLFAEVGGQVFSALFIAGYVAGCLASALSSQASGGRILFAMGRDRVLPQRMVGTLHARFRTPVAAMLILAVLSLGALFVDLTFIVSILSFGALFAYTVVNIAVVKCYLIEPRERSLRKILAYGVLPAIGAASTLWLWTSLSSLALIIGGIWAAIGLVYLLVLTRGFTRPVPQPDFTDSDPSDCDDAQPPATTV